MAYSSSSRAESRARTLVSISEPLPLTVIVREGRLAIGPELALRILTEGNFAGQRPVSEHHVTLLAEDMRCDRWTDGSQLAFALLDGELHLINGQHRMRAVIVSGATVVFQVLVNQVYTQEEMESLFFRFDRRTRARSDREVLHSLRIPEKYGLSAGMAKTVFSAALLISKNFERASYQADPVSVRSDDARLETAAPWWEAGAEYERMIAEAPRVVRKYLMGAQVTSVALVTIKHQPELAKEFWGGVAANDGLRRGDPRHTYLRDLQTRSTAGSHNAGAIAAAYSWSAFVENREITHLKVYDNSRVRIAGTPFDGRSK
jgi:hypothetical protein